MFAAMDLGGYTASEADNLRKVISKKKADELMMHRSKFVAGCVVNGIDEKVATEIFNDWENFARYGFNKSHAADYGVIAVETGYLKTHYTVEYMTALLSASKNEIEKVAYYAADARSLGIDVLPPDVNTSGWDFTIEDRAGQSPAIRFGMGAIKNVGQAPIDLIMLARAGKPFRDLNEFSKRVDLRQVGRRAMESLIKVGAFDCFGDRKSLLDSIDRIMAVSSSHYRALQAGQMSFFGSIEGVEEDIVLAQSQVTDRRELLEWERELIGLYVSDHPLTPYLHVLQKKVTHFSAQLGEVENKGAVTVAGLVTHFRSHLTKTNKMMGFITLEDIQGNIELVVFPRTWEHYSKMVDNNRVLLVKGKVDAEGNEPKVLVDTISVVDPDEETFDMPEAEMPPAVGLPPDSFPAEADDLAPLASLPEENAPAAPWPEKASGIIDESLPDWDEMPPPPEPDDWHLMASPYARAEKAPARAADTAVDRTIKEAQAVLEVSVFTPKIPDVNYLISPTQDDAVAIEEPSRMLQVVIQTSGVKEKDALRMKRVHGILRSSPGKDHFSFMLYEGSHQFLVEFPTETTMISEDMMGKLVQLVGKDNVQLVY